MQIQKHFSILLHPKQRKLRAVYNFPFLQLLWIPWCHLVFTSSPFHLTLCQDHRHGRSGLMLLLCHVIYHPQIGTYLPVSTRLLHVSHHTLCDGVSSPVHPSTLSGITGCLCVYQSLQGEVLRLKAAVCDWSAASSQLTWGWQGVEVSELNLFNMSATHTIERHFTWALPRFIFCLLN